jgi:hypothetical protein
MYVRVRVRLLGQGRVEVVGRGSRERREEGKERGGKVYCSPTNSIIGIQFKKSYQIKSIQ